MGKQKQSLQTHHVYLGAGGVLAVVALVTALTFGLSSAQDMHMGGHTMPSGGTTYTPPPDTTYTQPTTTYTAPTTSTTQPTTTYTDPTTSTTQPTTGACTAQTGTPQPGQFWACNHWETPHTGTTGTQPTGDPVAGCSSAGGTWKTADSTHPQAWCDMAGAQHTGQYQPGQQQPGMQTGQQPTGDPVAGCSSAGGTWKTADSTHPQAWCDMAGAQHMGQYQPGQQQPGMQGQQPGMQGQQPGMQQGMQPSFPSADEQLQCQAKEGYTRYRSKRRWDNTTNAFVDMADCAAWDVYEAAERAKWASQDQLPGGPGGQFGGQMPGGPMPSPGGQFGSPFGPFGGPFGPFPGPGGPFMGPGFGGPQMGGPHEGEGFGGPQGEVNPCDYQTNNPFCALGGQFQFGTEHQFDPTQWQGEADKGRLKQEFRSIKRDLPQWKRDLKQGNSRKQEVTRESGGLACPVISEVETILSELETSINSIEAANPDDEASLQEAVARAEYVRGKFDETGEQIPGIQQKLFGGPPDEDGNPTPGKMQSLDSCRQFSFKIAESCRMARMVGKEVERLQGSGLPDEVIAAGENAVEQLNQICNDAAGYLASKGISAADLFAPWQPDPEVCGFGFGGPGPGGPFPGPMPFGGPEMGGPMGGPGGGPGGPFMFGPPGGFGGGLPPEMMKLMEEKMKEFQSGGGDDKFGGGFGGGFGGFPGGGGGFGPFGFNSVLLAPSHPDFIGEEFGEIDEECMPPIERAFDFRSIMQPLDEMRRTAFERQDQMNICKGIEMGSKMAKKQKPPKAILDLLAEGQEECAKDEPDQELLEFIMGQMMDIGRRGFDLVDEDEFFDEYDQDFADNLLKERKEAGEDEDEVLQAIEALKGEVADLRGKLEEANKQVLQLLAANKELNELLTNVVKVVGKGDENVAKAIATLAVLPNDKQIEVKSTTEDILGVVENIKERVLADKNIPKKDAEKVMKISNNLIEQAALNPVTEATGDAIVETLTAVQLSATTGVTGKELANVAIDGFAEALVLQAADASASVAGGLRGGTDFPNSTWYAANAIKGRAEGLIASGAEMPALEPDKGAIVAESVARITRVLGVTVDPKDKDPVEGLKNVPEWVLPHLNALEESKPEFVDELRKEFSDLSALVERLDESNLLFAGIGDLLEKPSSAEVNEIVENRPDLKKLPAEDQLAAATMVHNNIMDSCDGTNFCPGLKFNRAQEATAIVNAAKQIKSLNELKNLEK